MKLAIMQPYFLPYVGYWQLIAAVDKFVVYDSIKYTKKGWINRNRFLLNGRDKMFTIALQKASSSLTIVERELAAEFNREKLINQLSSAYRKAPYFLEAMPVIENIIRYPEQNLFRYIHHSIVTMCRHLQITTPIIVSSSISIDHSLKAQDKVIAICKAQDATVYINPIGGTELYAAQEFERRGIMLKFIKSNLEQYKQFDQKFVPWLSIVDMLMFNKRSADGSFSILSRYSVQ